jgi:hypothetical protein
MLFMEHHAGCRDHTRLRRRKILAVALAEVMIVVGAIISGQEQSPGEMTVGRTAAVVRMVPEPARDVQEWIRDGARGGTPSGERASDTTPASVSGDDEASGSHAGAGTEE